MIGCYQEAASQEVTPPVPDGMYEPYELTLIRHQGAMSWRHRPTKEHERVLAQQQHIKVIGRSVALDDEGLREVGENQHRRLGHYNRYNL